jgi:hypothetical protein
MSRRAKQTERLAAAELSDLASDALQLRAVLDTPIGLGLGVWRRRCSMNSGRLRHNRSRTTRPS